MQFCSLSAQKRSRTEQVTRALTFSSPWRVGEQAGRFLHYCCICPSSAARHTCEPSALRALQSPEESKCLLGYLLPAASTRSACYRLPLLLAHHFYCLLGYGSEYFMDPRQGIGRWYNVYVICPTPANPAATVTK